MEQREDHVWTRAGRHHSRKLDRMPSAVDPERTVLRGRKSAITRPWKRIAAGLALGMLVIVAAVWAVLSHGLSSAALTEVVRARLDDLSGTDFRPRLGETRLTLDGLARFSAEADGIVVQAAGSNRTIVSVDNARMRLRLLPLLSGRVELADVTFSGVVLDPGAMRAEPDRVNTMPFVNADGLVEPQRLAETLMARMSRIAERVQAVNFEQVVVNDIRIRRSGTDSLSIPNITVRSQAEGRVGIDGLVLLSGGIAVLSGTAHPGDKDGRKPDFRLSLSGIPISLPLPKGRFDGDEVRSCQGEATLVAEAGGEAALPLAVTARSDTMACNLLDQGLYDVSAAISLAIGPEKAAFEILPSTLTVNRSAYSFEGGIRPLPAGEGKPARYDFEIVTREASVNPVDGDAGALALGALLAGRVVPSERTWALDTITVKTATGEASGAVSMVLGPQGRGTYAAVRADAIAVDDLKRIWPSFAAPAARRWVLQNVSGGVARDLRFELAIPPEKDGKFLPLDADEINGSARLEGVRFDTVGNMPPIRGADLTVSLAGVTASVEATGGTAWLPSGAEIPLGSAVFRVDDTHVRPVKASVDIVTGEADAAALAGLAAAASPSSLAALPFAPDDLSGRASAQARIALVFPAKGAPRVPPVVTAKATFSGLSVAKPVGGQDIRDAAGTVSAGPDGLVLDARLVANGLPAEISFAEPPAGKGKPEREVRLSLDKKAVERLAPGIAPFFSGRASVVRNLANGDDRFAVDLTDARIRVPAIGWEKSEGVASKAQFRLVSDGSLLTIKDLLVEGRSHGAKGSITLEGGSLSSASFSNVRLSSDDSFSAEITRNGRRTMLSLNGRRLDARAVLTRLVRQAEADGSAGNAALSVSGRIASLIGHNGVTLTDAAFEQDGGLVMISGALSEGGSMRLSYGSGEAGRSLAVQTDNAGAVLRFADLYRRLRGGVLNIDLKPLADRSGLGGTVAMSDFVVVGEPKLSRLMQSGAGESQSLADATGRRIDLSEARFRIARGTIVRSRSGILLSDGIVRGDAVGLTAEGVLLAPDGGIDLRGSFLPAYGLNALVGGIPVIGAILGAGERRGLIGVTYRLTGQAREPTITINPLSIIAPGVFRQIFE